MEDLESMVKTLIQQSIKKRINGFDRIDPVLENFALVERWLTDIMAIGYNDNDLEAAARDIFDIQHGITGIVLDEARARVYLSSTRFPDEIEAFRQYVVLREAENEDVILFAVKKELELVDEGSLFVV